MKFRIFIFLSAVYLKLILFEFGNASIIIPRNHIQPENIEIEEKSFLESARKDFENTLHHEDLSIDDTWSDEKIKGFCTECVILANRAIDEIHSSETAINMSINICLQLGLGTQAVCEGMVNENGPEVIYITQNTPNITGKDICGMYFESKGCKTNDPARNWEVNFPDVSKPPIHDPPFISPDTIPTFKILHISDTHHDPLYAPYSNANCEDEYFCCRAESGAVVNESDAAGFWGDYRNCDIPKWTLEAMYQHIKDTHNDIDFILWTGDVVPHIVWDTDKVSTLEILMSMTDLLLEYFPDIPVYPALGNHDSNVVDQFSPPYITDVEFDMDWLYDPLASIWGNWLSSETFDTIRYSGYYSINAIKPGLRLFSLNTNYCTTKNWWLVMDSSDIGNQLQTLVDFLQDAEDDGEFVYLIQHHHPDSCFHVYSHQYNLITARYENTIVGIFFGHAHKDQYRLFMDPEDADRVYEVGYIPGSQTTYSSLNPGYKIYTVEGNFVGSRYRVLDHENWYLPLDEANAKNESDFKILYTALEDYDLLDLSPQTWLNFTYTMSEPDNPYFNDFYRNFVKNATPSLYCDDHCKHHTLCKLLDTDSSLTASCRFD